MISMKRVTVINNKLIIASFGGERTDLLSQIKNVAKTYSVGTEKESKATLYRRDYGSDLSRFETIMLGREGQSSNETWRCSYLYFCRLK